MRTNKILNKRKSGGCVDEPIRGESAGGGRSGQIQSTVFGMLKYCGGCDILLRVEKEMLEI